MPRTVQVAVTLVVLSAIAVAIFDSRIDVHSSPTWWAVVPFFFLLVLAERLDVRFRSGGHVESVNLFEAALVPVLFAFPGEIVVALVSAAWLVAGVLRRNHPVKLVFNAAAWGLAAGIAAAVLSLGQSTIDLSTRGLVLLVVSMTLVGVVNQTLLTMVMALAQGQSLGRMLRALSPVILPGWIAGWALNTLIGFLFVFAYDANPVSVLLYFVPLTVLYAAYRGYAGTESDRMRLGGLHRASRVLNISGSGESALPSFLAEVSRCFEAEYAELVLVTDGGIVVHRVRDADPKNYQKEIDAATSDDIYALILTYSDTVRGSVEAGGALGAALERAGYRDCLSASLPGDQIVSGALIVYNQSGIEGFEEGERAVLEALARESSSSFEKGRLFDAVIHERRRLTQMVDVTSDGVLTISYSGVVRSWNPGWEEITQIPASLAIGRELSEIIAFFDVDGNEVALSGWSRSFEDLPGELQLFDRAGNRRWLECSYRIESVEPDAPRSLIVVARDNTDERRIEQMKQDMDRLAELEAAQRARVLQLQESLQPDVPDVESSEFGVFYKPSDTSAPTGGDFYDWQRLPSGDVHITVVDVLGSGVEATNDAFAVIHTLRTLAFQGVPVERLVREADHLLASLNDELVATVVCVRYDPRSGFVRIAGGGHPPPLLIREGGSVVEVGAPGIPVGWPGAGSDRAVDLYLGDRDTLLLYTDGLVEAQRDILLGLEALAATAAQCRDLPADNLAHELVERSLEGAARRDDSLALVLRHRAPSTPNVFRMHGPPRLDYVRAARHDVVDWITSPAVGARYQGEGLLDDLAIIVSELVTNAVRVAASYVELRVNLLEDGVLIEVEDDGAGFSDTGVVSVEPDFDDERGRGLFIVKNMTSELSVHSSGSGALVRAFLRAPSLLADAALDARFRSSQLSSSS